MTVRPSPLLAVVRSQPSGDGVGYVGMLLRAALARLAATEPRVVALDAADMLRPTRTERLRFTWRLARAQRAVSSYPVIFNHLGIARAQRTIPRPLRKPYAVFLHGVEIWDPELDRSRRAAVRGAVLRLSNSRYTAERVGRAHPDLGPIVPCPLSLLPDAAAPTKDDEMAARRLAGDTRSRVIIVGRMSSVERYKGHDELLSAWPRVVSAVPHATLFIVGAGDDLGRLAALAEGTGVGGRVVFTGFLPDSVMRALLRVCDVFAMPSRGEGFGLAYLEAMRAGLPCIGSTADAGQDVIVHDVTGLLVPTSPAGEIAVGALAGSIIDLLGDRNRRIRLGEAGRRREAEDLSFRRFEARLGEALASVHG